MLLGKKKAEQLLLRLRDARKSATMKTAGFSDELKEETRLYRDSWIITPLDDVIKEIERIYEPKHCDSDISPDPCPHKPVIRRLYKYGNDFKNLCRECADKDKNSWHGDYIKSESRLLHEN